MSDKPMIIIAGDFSVPAIVHSSVSCLKRLDSSCDKGAAYKLI